MSKLNSCFDFLVSHLAVFANDMQERKCSEMHHEMSHKCKLRPGKPSDLSGRTSACVVSNRMFVVFFVVVKKDFLSHQTDGNKQTVREPLKEAV